ncbi:MAG TPA: hypothetical protein VNX23_16015 [Bradyrhizobium sp.]|uniref:DUF6894 family protein n=1 Tax=Bradyrhizobium sp. TaxID=376 RepID=UPI002BD0A03A|nr:hypothetical protein [Bradyrhizobium sp.]HXB78880.1 hypothetical protein [Bradyrhizobium sp.]
MARLYLHCSNPENAPVRRRSTAVGDPAEVCEQATLAVQALIAAPIMEDWRGWVLHVSDENGEEIFNLPFDSLLGKSH